MNKTTQRTADAAPFLPMFPEEMKRLGWDALDVLLITGDAYVDHPAFGAALLGRWLVSHGFRVGIVAQPRWQNTADLIRLGRPRLFVGVTAGALDSMVAHYTAFRKKRHDDAYTPGGFAGARPNRATIVYTNLARQAFPGLPIVIGGLEASMRRATHYDFWSDNARRSILLDSKADLLIYGMAERAILAVAERLRDCSPAGTKDARETNRLLRGIEGTVYIASESDFGCISNGRSQMADTGAQNCETRDPSARTEWPEDMEVLRLPSHEEILADPKKLMTATLLMERQVHNGAWAVQPVEKRMTVFAAPAKPLTADELDSLYRLPFHREAHPSYREEIPALRTVQFSITGHRGCAGGCSFCSLALHQGRRILSRSAAGILAEATTFTTHPQWRGSVSDIGGPTANMWGASCAADPAACGRVSCLVPSLCANFRIDQGRIVELFHAVGKIRGVRSVRTASGIRHDLALRDRGYLSSLVGEMTRGQLKLAPEHLSDEVLRLMRKPPFSVFEDFLRHFRELSGKAGKEQYILPYLISAFPGCTDDDMRRLAQRLEAEHWKPQQVQCFTPTPGTVATAMYWAGIDPEGRPIPVARTDAERLRQHWILLGADAENRGASPSRPPRQARR